MFTMAYNVFAEWLNTEMNKQGINQSELARRAGVTRSTINGVMTGWRGPGPELCNKIANALNVPPDEVFRAAGLLPEKIQSGLSNQINHLSAQLTPQEQAGLVEYIKMRIKLQKGKGKNEK